ncbi:MAG: serine/threonine-protein kinase [Pirellula sp.]|jgi:serine/threonine protein kinase|nr:serine/threonine-protein kinase [Pirellula sp.]
MQIQSPCLSEARLREYIQGWIPENLQLEVESHLKECTECETTLNRLESDPDSFLEILQSDTPNSLPSPVTEGDSVIAYAISRAAQIATNSNDSLQAGLSNAPNETLKVIGPYEIIRRIGQGGMGTVYLAQHQALRKQVAIKLLPDRAFPQEEHRARFRREVQTAGLLNHSLIVNATDAGVCDTTHYLVMEYIDGLDLSRIVRSMGRLSLADACAIARNVAMGLEYAHSAGVVHRDIKPSNVMISRDGHVKILDFGLAQLELWHEASTELTTIGQWMGTLDYMAPEQAEGADRVDYRVDIYSLGATLFRLLAGCPPLATTPQMSPLAKLRLLAMSDPPNLGLLRPDLPQPVIELVNQLLQRDPGNRPTSAAQVAQVLAEWAVDSNLQELIRQADERLESQPMETSAHPRNPSVPSPVPPLNPSSSSSIRKHKRWILLAGVLLPGIACVWLLQENIFRQTLNAPKNSPASAVLPGKENAPQGMDPSKAAQSSSPSVGKNGMVTIKASENESELQESTPSDGSKTAQASKNRKPILVDYSLNKDLGRTSDLSKEDIYIEYDDGTKEYLTWNRVMERVPRVSFDDSVVAFLRRVDSNEDGVITSKDDETELWLMRLGNRAESRIASELSNPSSASWHPSKLRMSFIASSSDGKKSLYSYDLPSKRLERLSDDAGSWSEWSPCGNYIAYFDSKNRVALYDVTSRASKVLTEDIGRSYALYWFTDGRLLFRVNDEIVVYSPSTNNSTKMSETEVGQVSGYEQKRFGWGRKLRTEALGRRQDVPNALNVRNETLYQGKTLEEWLELFERDRSPASIGSALQGIESLISPSNARPVIDRILSTSEDLNGNDIIYNHDGSQLSASTLDKRLIQMLHKYFPDPTERAKYICEALNSKSDAFAERILFTMQVLERPSHLNYGSEGVRPSSPDLKRSDSKVFLDWANRKVFPEEGRPRLAPLVGNFLRRSIFETNSDADWTKQVIDSMARCSALNLRYYLEVVPYQKLPFGGGVADNRIWFQHVAQLATDGLLSETTPSEDKLLCCAMLRALITKGKESDEFASSIRRNELEMAISKSLSTLAKDPKRMLDVRVVQLQDYHASASNYRGLTIPTIGLEDSLARRLSDQLLGSRYEYETDDHQGKKREPIRGNLTVESIRLLQCWSQDLAPETLASIGLVADACQPGLVSLQFDCGVNNLAFVNKWKDERNLKRALPKAGWPHPNRIRGIDSDAQTWMSFFILENIVSLYCDRAKGRESSEYLRLHNENQQKWGERLLTKSDANGDGVVSVEEISNGTQQFVFASYTSAPRDDLLDWSAFQRDVDPNRDGNVELHELLLVLNAPPAE